MRIKEIITMSAHSNSSVDRSWDCNNMAAKDRRLSETEVK